MNSTLTFIRTELLRTRRNGRYLIFAVAIPVVMFLSFSGQSGQLSNLDVAAYIMVSMATFGAMNCVLATSARIGMDRSTGWNRQLRLTALSGRSYLFGKVVASMATALVPLVVIMLLAHFVRGVDLSALQWVKVLGSITVALLPMAAFAVWLGYRVRPEGMQAVSGIVFSGCSLVGGLWIPIEQFPTALADVSKALPMYWVADAGRSVLSGTWLGWEGLAILAAWTIGLGALAARSYVRDSLRA